MQGVAGSGVHPPSTPGLGPTDDGIDPPPLSGVRTHGGLMSPRVSPSAGTGPVMGPEDADLFGQFSSVTLTHDGEMM